jgi:hypothetical protein
LLQPIVIDFSFLLPQHQELLSSPNSLASSGGLRPFALFVASPAFFSCSGLLSITMLPSLPLAACKLFTKGIVGDSLLDNLPDDLFPANDTWNQYPYLSEDMILSLRENCSPSRISNPHEQTFVEMSTGAVHTSPAHRLWTTEDAFAANQHTHFGFSIMVLRFCKVDGDFTDPLLVITGPIATPFLGALLPTNKLLGLSDDDPLPLTRGLGIPTDPPASPAASD